MKKTDGVIRVYVCPREGCANYYGSSSMGKLEDQQNQDIRGHATTTRDRCPICGTPRVERYAWLISEEYVRTVIREQTILRDRRKLRPVT